MNPIQVAIDRLLSYQVREVWVHEKMLYSMLPKVQGKSKREVLTTVINSLRKGYIGRTEDQLTIPQGTHDIEEKNNSLKIVMVKKGTYEDFQTHELAWARSVKAQPRWFGWDDPQIEVKTQLYILKLMMGKHKGLREDAIDGYWETWYSNRPGGSLRSYQTVIDDICDKYDVTVAMIRQFLLFSNKVGTSFQSSTRSASTHHSVSVVSSQRSPAQLQTPNSTRRLQESLESPVSTLAVSSSPTTTTTTTTTPSIPVAFWRSTIINSKTTTTTNTDAPTMMDWKQLESLACKELVIRLIQEKITEEEIMVSLKKANLDIKFFTLIEMMGLSNRSLHNAEINIRTIRQEQESLRNGMFIPQKHQMLHEWITDGK